MNHKDPNTPKAPTLRDICTECVALKPFFMPGIGAMNKAERKSIKVPDTKLLGGSVALDEAARAGHPRENRWDYAIDYEGNAFFIEVHPASTSEIDCLVEKVKFVKRWLNTHALELLNLPQKEAGARQFYWVSSGSTDLRVTQGSPQARKMALNHIKPVGKIWDFSKIFRSR